jgi:hypothetical protein
VLYFPYIQLLLSVGHVFDPQETAGRPLAKSATGPPLCVPQVFLSAEVGRALGLTLQGSQQLDERHRDARADNHSLACPSSSEGAFVGPRQARVESDFPSSDTPVSAAHVRAAARAIARTSATSERRALSQSGALLWGDGLCSRLTMIASVGRNPRRK